MTDTARLGIGDEMHYTDNQGGCFVGMIINMAPARLLDTVTDETYAARKFYLWNEKLKRGTWVCVMRPTAPLPEPEVSDAR